MLRPPGANIKGKRGQVEAQLRASLAEFTHLPNSSSSWQENPADGAFYGPKIDVELTDALGRGSGLLCR